MDNVPHNLADIAPCGIFTFTNEGIITNANSYLLDILRYRQEELAGQSIEKILTLASRIFYQTHLSPLLRLQGKANEIFLTLLSKDKKAIPVLINAGSHVQDNIEINICACISVNERKKYEDEILQAKKIAEDALQTNELLQKVKQELENGKQQLDMQVTQLKYRNKELLQLNDLIAHDLQEPIRKISTFVDLLLHDNENTYSEKAISSLNIIARSAERIRMVLRNLQEYMHISTMKIHKQSVDLNLVIQTQLENIAKQFPEIRFTTDIENFKVIAGDKEQLQLLFEQLLKNCFQFKNVERSLHINISGISLQENFYNSTEDKYKYVDVVKIAIEDNGIGFDKRYKELIFKILKKLNPKTKGLGFGLAICKRIAENHNGYITATGIENEGATFTITIPTE